MAKLSYIESRKARAVETIEQRTARLEKMVEAIYEKTFGKPFEAEAPAEVIAESVSTEAPAESKQSRKK